jgi:hypothetical protein
MLNLVTNGINAVNNLFRNAQKGVSDFVAPSKASSDGETRAWLARTVGIGLAEPPYFIGVAK